MAGASPKRIAARTVTPRVKASTRPSSGMSSLGAAPGARVPEIISRIRIVAPTRAPATPSTPPIEASSSDSVSTCRTMRQRPAPSETRTAISG